MSFAEIAKDLRAESGLSQMELSKKIGISSSGIGHLELGQREPGSNTLIAYSSYFGVTTDYLLGLEDDFGNKKPSPADSAQNGKKDIIKRPEYALAEKFATDYKELLKSKYFLDITKLCNATDEATRAVALGYIARLLESQGVNTSAIIGY